MLNIRKERLFILAFIISGFSSMTAQIMILRELMMIFSGNELTVGIGMAVWLICTAAGSYIISHLIKKSKISEFTFFGTEFILAILFAITFYMIRISPEIWNLTRGEMSDLHHIILIPFTTLLFLCVFNGMIYTIGSLILSRIGRSPHIAASRVYLYEGIGSGLATFMASILLIRYLDIGQLVGIICFSYLLSSSLWLLYHIRGEYKRVLLWISYVLIMLVLVITIIPHLESETEKRFWGDLNLIHSETTIYGRIAVTKLEDSISFYESGYLIFSYPDLYYAEESVHFALLQHSQPQNVLLIGGGMGGNIEQILKHPSVNRIDYVELDPAIIELGRLYLPHEVTRFLDDERVHVWNMDGRLYLKNCQLSYDVVIVNLPDPNTTQINRFYSIEFFRQINEVMQSGAILGYSVVSSENYISDELARFLGCLYYTTRSVFPDVLIIPGDSNYFIAAKNANVLSENPHVLIERLNERELNTTFIREYYLPFRMSRERLDYLKNRIDSPEYNIVNGDFNPVANYLNLIVWTTYFDQTIKNAFEMILKSRYLLMLILPGILVSLFIAWGLFLKKEKITMRNIVLVSVFMVGFSSMSLEVIIMLGFQAIYGYMYYQLALILSGFMIGLSVGSYFSIRFNQKIDHRMNVFLFIQTLIMCFSGVLIITLELMSHSHLDQTIVQSIFSVLILTAGFLCGFQFPTATLIYRQFTERIERIAGVLYAWDLFGACLGALTISAIFIPALGVIQACFVLMLVNAMTVVGLIYVRRFTTA